MNAVDTISFSVESFGELHRVAQTVVPLVNGIALIDLVTQFEVRTGFEPVGGYGGIVPQFFDFGPLDDSLMGRLDLQRNWAQLGGIYLLGCECGEVGCWPLLSRVREDERAVVWDEFKQPHRPERDFSQFGPFVFDALQYRDSVRNLQAQLTTRW